MLAQVAFTIIFILAPCARGDLSSCFTENSTWISSDIIDTFEPVDDYNECQQLCTDHHNCSAFTWTSEENHHTKLFCFLFGVTGTVTTCEHCISGPQSCTCSTESACSAQEENVIDVVNGVIEEVDCQSLCSSNTSCSLYTWYDSTSFPSYTCILLTSCAERDNNCSGCFTGPPDCSVYIPTYTPGGKKYLAIRWFNNGYLFNWSELCACTDLECCVHLEDFEWVCVVSVCDSTQCFFFWI